MDGWMEGGSERARDRWRDGGREERKTKLLREGQGVESKLKRHVPDRVGRHVPAMRGCNTFYQPQNICFRTDDRKAREGKEKKEKNAVSSSGMQSDSRVKSTLDIFLN
jgi:hypothetical protein